MKKKSTRERDDGMSFNAAFADEGVPLGTNVKENGKRPRAAEKLMRHQTPSNTKVPLGTKMGKIRLRALGFNQMRLLGTLSEKNIKIERIDRKNAGEMTFTIRSRDLEKTFAILDKMCYTYTVTERSDFKSMATVAAARVGLVLGLVIFTAVLTLFYGFIWRIEIDGNQKVDDLTIERALSSSGVHIGKPAKNLDKDHIRNLVNSIPGILESSVEINGTLLKIDVIETTDYNKPGQDNFNNLLSLYDAEVTRLITTSGTAEVKIGSVIKKGACIIGAYRLDSEQNKIETPAKGEAYGKTAFSKTIDFNIKECFFLRTGKTFVSTDYSIWGLKINGKTDHGFEYFETEKESGYAFDNFFVPIKLNRTVYYETEYCEKTYDAGQRAEYYKNIIIEENVIKAGGAPIETSHHLTKISDSVYRLSVYIVAEMKITA